MTETREITWEPLIDPAYPRIDFRRARLGIVQAQLERVYGEGWGWRVTAQFPGPSEAEPLLLEGGEWSAFDTEAEAMAQAEAVMRRIQGWWEREQASG